MRKQLERESYMERLVDMVEAAPPSIVAKALVAAFDDAGAPQRAVRELSELRRLQKLVADPSTPQERAIEVRAVRLPIQTLLCTALVLNHMDHQG